MYFHLKRNFHLQHFDRLAKVLNSLKIDDDNNNKENKTSVEIAKRIINYLKKKNIPYNYCDLNHMNFSMAQSIPLLVGKV